MHNQASRYSEVGRLEEALGLTEQVVALQKSKLGEDHPDTLMSIHELANLYSEAGQLEEGHPDTL